MRSLSSPFLAAFLLLGALAGCQPNVIGATPDAGADPVVDAGQSVDAGEPGDAGIRGAYPAGPYGITVNQRIQNFTFTGYYSDQSTALASTSPLRDFDLQSIRSAVDANGKPYRYLLIAISAVWCQPCNSEAESLGLAGADHANIERWLGRGGLFMTILVEGGQHGVSPTQAELNYWITSHKVTNSVVMDTTHQLASAGIDPYGIPANLVVDLQTMKMVAGWSGNDPTYARWEGVLAQ